jgi:hypothetical protein
LTALIAETKPGGAYFDWKDSAAKFRVVKREYDYVPLFIEQQVSIAKEAG